MYKSPSFALNFRGAFTAEIIPYEPDADNAAEGKSRLVTRIPIPTVV